MTSFAELSSCTGRQSNKMLIHTARNAKRNVNHCISFVIAAQTPWIIYTTHMSTLYWILTPCYKHIPRKHRPGITQVNPPCTMHCSTVVKGLPLCWLLVLLQRRKHKKFHYFEMIPRPYLLSGYQIQQVVGWRRYRCYIRLCSGVVLMWSITITVKHKSFFSFGSWISQCSGTHCPYTIWASKNSSAFTLSIKCNIHF